MARTLAVTSTVPQWLVDRVLMWQELLHLEHWSIRVDLALCLNGNPDTRACCHQQHRIRVATLTFRADVVDDEEWNTHVAHEMLHIAHAHVDEMVERLTKHLPPDMAEYVIEAYIDAVEPFVENLSQTLHVLRAPRLEEGE